MIAPLKLYLLSTFWLVSVLSPRTAKAVFPLTGHPNEVAEQTVRREVKAGLQSLRRSANLRQAFGSVVILHPQTGRRGRDVLHQTLGGHIGYENTGNPHADAFRVLGWLRDRLPGIGASVLDRLKLPLAGQVYQVDEEHQGEVISVTRGGTLYRMLEGLSGTPEGVGFADLLATNRTQQDLPRVRIKGAPQDLFLVGRRIWVTDPRLPGEFPTLGWDRWIHETGEETQHPWVSTEPEVFPSKTKPN